MDDLSHPPKDTVEDAPPKRPSKFSLRLAACVFAALLIVLFYAIENWRGARAWAAHRSALSARNERIEWQEFLVPAPPVASNMMKVGQLENWFIRGRADSNVNFSILGKFDSVQPVPLAIVEIVPAASPTADEFVADALIRARLIDHLLSRRFSTPMGPYVYNKSAEPPRLKLGPSAPKPEVLAASLKTLAGFSDSDAFAIEPTGPNSFALFPGATAWWDSRELLKESAAVAEKLALVTQAAAAHPATWLDGDHSRPDKIPVQNFVNIRTAAQTAGARVQAYLLLGKPAEALGELRAIQSIRRMLESRPTTLVAVMIDVAIQRLALDIVENAFAQNLWTENELRELLAAPANGAFIRNIGEAMRGERAAVHAIVRQRNSIWIFDDEAEEKKPWWRRKSTVAKLMPQGWIDSALTLYSEIMQQGIDALTADNGRVSRPHVGFFNDAIEAAVMGHHPRRYLAAGAIPNLMRAIDRALQAETWSSFARIAAALELHKLKTGAYPENLSELAPTYFSALPLDALSGRPLQYRRLAGSYLLYSTANNKKDEVAPWLEKNGESLDCPESIRESDWIWRGSPPLKPSSRAVAAQSNP